MQFVKTHWILLASGVAALVGIVLAVIGMTRDNVVAEMKKRMQLAAQIGALAKDAQNQATIDAEVERGRKFGQEYENVVQAAESINERQPLMEGVFPEPAQLDTPYRFRETYKRRMWELPHALKAGSLPNEDEIRDEAEIMADLERRKQEQGGDTTEGAEAPGQPTGGPPLGGGKGGGFPPVGGGGKGGATPPVGGGGKGGALPPVGGGGKGGGPALGGGGKGGAAPAGGGRARAGPSAGQTPRAVAAQGRPATPLPTGVQADEARRRAAVKKARSIRIYASADTSFHVSPIAYSEDAPRPADMWFAQVSLWIQEDLASAIARLNDEAAQQMAGKEINVASMPVKNIESIRVHGYMSGTGALLSFSALSQSPTGRPGAAGPAGPVLTSFTGRKPNDQFDVVRLTLTAVVDERYLLQLIDSITRANFYQLVGLEYATVEPAEREGYFYGDAPAVRAVLDFEGYMARKIYKALMPEDVLRALGITGPGAGKEAPKKK